MPRRGDAGFRYGLVFAAVLAALLVRLALSGPLGERSPFLTFMAAVAVVARYAGLRPTLLAIALSVLAVEVFLLSPAFSFRLTGLDQVFGLGLFVVLSLLLAWLGESQREALRAVAAERQRLRAVLEGIGDAVVATDEDGRITFLNGVGEALTGWSAQDAAGRPLGEVLDLSHPESGASLIAGLLREASEQVVRAEPTPASLRDRSGERRAVEHATAPIWGPSGECCGVVLVFRDIGARQRAERAITESEARFRQLADSMPQIVWVTRPDGHHEYFNRRWYEYTGQTPEESLGDGWRLPLHPDDRPRAEARWREATATGDPYEIQYRFRGADGTPRWFLGRALPVRDDAGRITRWFGTCTDIDLQKRTEEALVESRQRLRAALFASDTGTFRWNLATDELEFDESLDRLFGIEPGQAVRRIDHFTRAVHPDDLPRVHRELDHCRRDDRDFDLEYRVLLPDGGVRWLLDRGKLLRDESGHPTTMIGACTDITHRKAVEAELIAAKEQAEAASRAKDQFLAMLSHELRTPLTPVLMSATAMLDDPATPADFRPFLDLVRQNIALEARLIDDLLDVMRIIRGKLPYHFEVVDLHALIGRTADICRPEVEAKGLALRAELDAARPHVRGDAARLQQVFWNLVKNAAKFTPVGGTITIRTRDAEGDPARVVVAVTDTGIGIDREALPRIFNAFEQAEDDITRRFGGLGLGLAISRSVAEAHGGALTAQSDGRDRGATFALALDAVPAPDATTTASTAPSPEAEAGARPDADADGAAAAPGDRPVRLLLVEDDPLASRVMAQLLRRVGHQVTTATTVQGALAIPPEDYDLVVSDIGLPDGSGHDVMRQIRPHHDVPGIALTGYGSEDDIRRGQEAGFVAHLVKPIDFAKLDTIIRQVADGHVPDRA
jgi:PAS domain S-box-containing protein